MFYPDGRYHGFSNVPSNLLYYIDFVNRVMDPTSFMGDL